MRADLLWLAEKTRKGIGTYSDSTTTKATDPSIGPYPFTGERAGKPAKTLPRGSLSYAITDGQRCSEREFLKAGVLLL